jgi:hypothetical protein
MVYLRYVAQWSPMSFDIRFDVPAPDEAADHRVQ